MTAPTSSSSILSNGVRLAFGLSGLLALIVGLLILIWPGKTAVVITGILAVYAVAAGLVFIGLGVFSKKLGGWARVGHIVLGVLYVVAGVIAFMNLPAAAASIALIVTIMIGITWLIEGVVSLTTLGASSSKGWTVFFAIVSILAGVGLLLSPLWGAVVLFWLLGISLVAMGIVQIVRAFTFKADATV